MNHKLSLVKYVSPNAFNNEEICEQCGIDLTNLDNYKSCDKCSTPLCNECGEKHKSRNPNYKYLKIK